MGTKDLQEVVRAKEQAMDLLRDDADAKQAEIESLQVLVVVYFDEFGGL